MISLSHWGLFDEPERSWLDRGDGLPVFWDRYREFALVGLREWAGRLDELRIISPSFDRWVNTK